MKMKKNITPDEEVHLTIVLVIYSVFLADPKIAEWPLMKTMALCGLNIKSAKIWG